MVTPTENIYVFCGCTQVVCHAIFRPKIPRYSNKPIFYAWSLPAPVILMPKFFSRPKFRRLQSVVLTLYLYKLCESSYFRHHKRQYSGGSLESRCPRSENSSDGLGGDATLRARRTTAQFGHPRATTTSTRTRLFGTVQIINSWYIFCYKKHNK